MASVKRLNFAVTGKDLVDRYVDETARLHKNQRLIDHQSLPVSEYSIADIAAYRRIVCPTVPQGQKLAEFPHLKGCGLSVCPIRPANFCSFVLGRVVHHGEMILSPAACCLTSPQKWRFCIANPHPAEGYTVNSFVLADTCILTQGEIQG